MIIDNVRQILKEDQLLAKKMFGQNFLCDRNVLKKIVEYGKISKEGCVIEIGPGLGSLTEVLALESQKVLSYEIDSDMVAILKRTLHNHKNIIIEEKDFLKVDLQADIKKYFPNQEKIKIVANLPYYITTPIIMKLLKEVPDFPFLLMVQKEVGERLCSKVGEEYYNALSVLMNYKTISKIVSVVSPNSFFPVPKVESVLLSGQAIKRDCGLNNEDKFTEFISKIFKQKRKTLINNLVSGYGLNKEEMINILKEYSLSPTIRSEALDLAQIIDLYKKIFQ